MSSKKIIKKRKEIKRALPENILILEVTIVKSLSV